MASMGLVPAFEHLHKWNEVASVHFVGGSEHLYVLLGISSDPRASSGVRDYVTAAVHVEAGNHIHDEIAEPERDCTAVPADVWRLVVFQQGTLNAVQQ